MLSMREFDELQIKIQNKIIVSAMVCIFLCT